MSNLTNYGDDSISSLKGAERVRLRPAAMLGTDDIHGAFHTIIEILGNSLDEARAGFGKKLIVKYHKDGSISIRDFGRGVPMGWNESEQRYNWDLIFNELYAGGKYGKAKGKPIEYIDSVGLNGLGCACTQYTSEWFIVHSYRDGKRRTKEFKKGYPLDMEQAVEVDDPTTETGTYIQWKPDIEVFSAVEFPNIMLKRLLEVQAHLNEIVIDFHDEFNGQEPITIEGKGLRQYFIDSMPSSDVVKVYSPETLVNSGVESGKEFAVKLDLHMAVTNENGSLRPMYFHNTAIMTQGKHSMARTTALETFFKALGKDHKLQIQASDYEKYLNFGISTRSNPDSVSFIGQTKTGVSNEYVFNIIYNGILDLLEELYAKQDKEFMVTIEKILNEAQIRKEIKELEQRRKLVNQATKTKRRETAEKFVGATNLKHPNLELFIVEGDAALLSCKQARDPEHQALLPLRGKPINALKATLKKLMDNEIVKDIIKTLQCGVETSDGSGNFDEDALPYQRIIFATDADVDGQQIRVLLYTIFYVLFPTLLRKGYVYVVESPLYEVETVTNGEPKSYFAYSSAEKDRLVERLKRDRIRIVAVNRSKGLGSNTDEMMSETTMRPETRKLVPLTIDINETLVRMISEMLFGEDKEKARKGYILEMLKNNMSTNVDVFDLAETVDAVTGEHDIDISGTSLYVGASAGEGEEA